MTTASLWWGRPCSSPVRHHATAPSISPVLPKQSTQHIWAANITSFSCSCLFQLHPSVLNHLPVCKISRHYLLHIFSDEQNAFRLETLLCPTQIGCCFRWSLAPVKAYHTARDTTLHFNLGHSSVGNILEMSAVHSSNVKIESLRYTRTRQNT